MNFNDSASGQRPALSPASGQTKNSRRQTGQIVSFHDPRPRDPLAHSTARPRPERATRPILSFSHADLRTRRTDPRPQHVPAQPAEPISAAPETPFMPLATQPAPYLPQAQAVPSDLHPELHIEPLVIPRLDRSPSEGRVHLVVPAPIARFHDQDDTHLQATIEPLEPVAKPDFPARLTPIQRAQCDRPVTLRNREGRLAYVTYTFQRRG
jgi:hypothetical protein